MEKRKIKLKKKYIWSLFAAVFLFFLLFLALPNKPKEYINPSNSDLIRQTASTNSQNSSSPSSSAKLSTASGNSNPLDQSILKQDTQHDDTSAATESAKETVESSSLGESSHTRSKKRAVQPDINDGNADERRIRFLKSLGLNDTTIEKIENQRLFYETQAAEIDENDSIEDLTSRYDIHQLFLFVADYIGEKNTVTYLNFGTSHWLATHEAPIDPLPRQHR